MSNALSPNLENAVTGKYDWNIKEVFAEAWHKVSDLKGSFWGAVGWMFLVLFTFVILEVVIEGISGSLGFVLVAAASRNIFTFLFGTFGLIFATTFIYMMICHIAGRPIRAKMIFDWRGMFNRMLIVAIITYLVQFAFGFIVGMMTIHNQQVEAVHITLTFLATVLVLFLGYCYLWIIFRMAMYLIIEKRLTVGLAIKVAFMAISRHIFKNIWLMLLTYLFFMVATVLTLGIGLIWLAPMKGNLQAIWYRQIFGIEPAAQN